MPYYRLFYYFVWATKNRLPLITSANHKPIYAVIKTKVRELGGIIHALNGSNDHIHLIVTLPPKIALAEFIGQVKGCSSHLASRWKGHYEPFAWQREYGVLTVSESQMPHVVNYVEEQEIRHNENRLEEFLECRRDRAASRPHSPDNELSG